MFDLKLREPSSIRTTEQTLCRDFLSVIDQLVSPEDFPNWAINDIMRLFKHYVQEGQIKVAISQKDQAVVKHVLEEKVASTVYIPYDFCRFMEKNGLLAWSQILYSTCELTLWEKNKLVGQLSDEVFDVVAVGRQATAYEAEFLLTFQEFAKNKNKVLNLADSQRFVLEMYPKGLASLDDQSSSQ